MEPHVAQCLLYWAGSGNSWEKQPKVHSPREPCGMWRSSSPFTVRLWTQGRTFHSCLRRCVDLGPHLHDPAFLLLCLQSCQLSHPKFYFSVLGEYEQQLLTSAHLGFRYVPWPSPHCPCAFLSALAFLTLQDRWERRDTVPYAKSVMVLLFQTAGDIGTVCPFPIKEAAFCII